MHPIKKHGVHSAIGSQNRNVNPERQKYVCTITESSLDDSLFLFGPRGSGKSTLLRHTIPRPSALWYDLLLPEQEDRLAKDPSILLREVKALPPQITHVVIDEVQKVPAILNIVHHLIESTPKKFLLTGSSSRKLPRGGANLLAGRAIVFELFPLTSLELGNNFALNTVLAFGSLPKAVAAASDTARRRFLQSYALTYVKEEIQAEQIIRNLDPFRRFLQVCAQCSGKIINYASIARDVGVDEKTVRSYYAIMEDTHMGFFLEPFQTSIRKRLNQKPKFYFFDTGVQRALAGLLTVPVVDSTSAFGELFESFFINECHRLSRYAENDFLFSYLATRDNVEVDLIVERPGKSPLLIEIKSSTEIRPDHLKGLESIGTDILQAELICVARVPRAQQFGKVLVLPWQEALQKYFV